MKQRQVDVCFSHLYALVWLRRGVFIYIICRKEKKLVSLYDKHCYYLVGLWKVISLLLRFEICVQYNLQLILCSDF